jgi:MoxR-like ATPase
MKYTGNFRTSPQPHERKGADEFGRRAFRPEYYRPDPGLVDAVNTSLLLNMPLLLMGEPGVGKSKLADSVSAEFGLGVPLKFFAKSISLSRDLYYTYDAIGHFRASQTRPETDEVSPAEFIRLSALGKAIIMTRESGSVPVKLPSFQTWRKQRSVVLIDEIDKAPRDFPNDILNELEDLFFEIPELGSAESGAVRIEATRESELFPIVIITSNSEKDLPDAFLRRCVFYHIPFPSDPFRLRDIVKAHTGLLREGQEQLEKDALECFLRFRERQIWLKPPSPAELLDWIFVLSRRQDGEDLSLKKNPKAGRTTLPALFKTKADLGKAIEVFDEWASAAVPAPPPLSDQKPLFLA